jgi:putative acetyltransferase
MMARAHPKLAMRPFLPADVPVLAEIFRASIAELTGEDYSPTQQEAWASTANDEAAFGARLAGRLTLLGTMDGSPVGFAALEGPRADTGADKGVDIGAAKPARVDMLYVHPAAVGTGVGSMLIDALEKLAAARGAARLTADVSDSAQEFFKRRGFVPRQRNTVTLGDEWLANTTMDKPLAAKERAS